MAVLRETEVGLLGLDTTSYPSPNFKPIMRIVLLLALLLALMPDPSRAQVAMDENFIVPASLPSFALSAEPSIDGEDREWADIPWTYTSFNDRDFSELDDAVDPIPSRLDFSARYKTAWVPGVNKFFFFAEIIDDEFFNLEGQSIFHKDGMEIRIDPLDNDQAGEPDGSTAATNLIFGFNETVPNIEGSEPVVEAAWEVDFFTVPMTAYFEMSVEMPEEFSAEAGTILGFHVYFNENDDEDDSPDNKNAVLQAFPQLWSVPEARRLGVDELWSNVGFWGGVELFDAPTVHQVSEGMSIQATIDAASPGDIISIGAGTFAENLEITTSDLRIWGTLTPTEQTRITPASVTEPVISVGETAWRTEISNLYIDGFFDNGGVDDWSQAGLNIEGRDAHIHKNVITGFIAPLNILFNETLNIQPEAAVVEDNIFEFNNGSININTVNSTFRYNLVRETGPSGYAVRSLGMIGADNTIDFGYNIIYNARECGIGYGGTDATFTIHNNLIYRSYAERTSPTREMDDGIENQESTASRSFVFNNTVVGWDSDGMQFNSPSFFFARNNLVAYADNADYDLRNLPPADIDFGLSFQNGGGNVIETLGTNFSVENPLFVDEMTDNYALSDGSPAIDAGEAEPFGFKVKFAGDAPDIGAFETGLEASDIPVYGPAMEVLEIVSTNVERISDEIPTGFKLEQNYPNPFNPTTEIHYTLPASGMVTLTIHNALGQEVARLVDGVQQAGTFAASWNALDQAGRALPSGVYFYRLQAESFSETRSMILLK